MKSLRLYIFALLISTSYILVAQEEATDGEAPSTVQQLLELVKEGAIFQSTSDTETILQLVAKSKKKLSKKQE